LSGADVRESIMASLPSFEKSLPSRPEKKAVSLSTIFLFFFLQRRAGHRLAFFFDGAFPLFPFLLTCRKPFLGRRFYQPAPSRLPPPFPPLSVARVALLFPSLPMLHPPSSPPSRSYKTVRREFPTPPLGGKPPSFLSKLSRLELLFFSFFEEPPPSFPPFAFSSSLLFLEDVNFPDSLPEPRVPFSLLTPPGRLASLSFSLFPSQRRAFLLGTMPQLLRSFADPFPFSPPLWNERFPTARHKSLPPSPLKKAPA